MNQKTLLEMSRHFDIEPPEEPKPIPPPPGPEPPHGTPEHNAWLFARWERHQFLRNPSRYVPDNKPLETERKTKLRSVRDYYASLREQQC